ncbi:CLUMA_CG009693, isoform B [Clunio marinus]|uniref:CLUMA_CG009693, isoform B n=1 Tax=Clunio marinus TaxID=568069 RepID=A0A1J1IBB7_9DIPT|nr:CLUMA_CG009693, isoform B [Clunio marinus]
MICSRFKSIATLALIFLTLFITPLYVECGSKKSSSSAASAHEPTIEEVNAKQLERILSEKEYVAVYWYARSCVTCDTVLEELEKIDDDTDAFGVDFVKINDKRLAKQYGIHKFPALTYYREKQPIIYEGDLMDEEGVLDFLTSLEAMDLPDRIEEVNGKILAKIIEDTDYLAVLFCPDHGNCGHGLLNKPECRKCAKALQELENIDDEADQLGIGFVKIHDETLADEYNLGELPRLVYYRHKTPIIYENELSREEDVLEWLIENKSTGDDEDVIEEVSAKNLGTLIQNIDNLVVVFYGKDDDDSLQVIEELEKIDDDCDKHGIQFVKIDDKGAAKEHGVKELPTIIFFEKQEPTRYEGDLMDEDELLHWLLSHLENDEIEDIDEDELDRMVKEGRTMAVLFYDNNDKKSGKVLAELENIDDECDQLGIAFVKIDDAEEAKEYGIDKMPKLLYFEKGIPTVYEGNLEKEEEVLKWIEMQSSSDEIEDVTDEMLDIIISKMHHVAVLFYDKDSKKSQKVLAELENIDDECDQNDIAFVKIDDDNEAHEWGIDELPTMVLFERGIPHIYEGDLMQEDELLGWLIYQKKHSEIPEVTDEMKDKLIETFPHVAVIFYDKDDKQDIRVLNEMENIDDDLEREGIIIVRIDNADEAKEYGLNHLPAMVYFEDKIPAIYEGDLMNEDEVLEWLIIQKNTATIEEVTDEILDDLIEDHEYVVVYFTGDCEEGEKCDKILDDLENIDDELDEAGIIFVTTEELDIAKKYGIKSLPKLVFFRNKDPLIYSGDLDDEDEVLAWLTDENTLEIPGKIEEVNMKMLEKILSENDHIVVFFYPEGDKKSQKILNELENIDDECEEKDIDFVKTSDDGIATEYDLPTLPALAFYRHKFRTIYTGDLMNEDEILKWVLELIEATPDVIESVDRRTLQVLINDIEHLAVFFYSDKCETCPAILDRLETIDDDTDKHDIQFVKTDDVKLAHDIGVFSFPALIYYETGVPIMFDGNLKSEKKILQWLVDQKNDECFYVGIERGNDNAKKSEKSYVVPYQCCPSTKEKAQARLAVLSDTKLGTSKAIRNDITFTFEHDEEDKPAAKPKGGKKLKAPSKPAQEDRKSKKEDNKKDSAQEKKKRERDVKEKESRDTKDKDFDKKDKKGKDKKDKGDLSDEREVFDWIITQKNDESIEDVDRETFLEYIDTKDFLAVVFYDEDDEKTTTTVLRHIELIDDEASEYGIKIVKSNDDLMAKKFGYRNRPGITYFRKSKPINYDGDIDDEEEILDWLTNPDNMEMTDSIERANRKMFEKIRKASDYLAVFFYSDDCKQCPRVLAEIEHIDDEADGAGINFVKIDDKQMAKEVGVFALPAIVFYKQHSKEPVIYAGDLYDEEAILNWLLTQKNPGGDIIEDLEGQKLKRLIEESPAIAVYFWNKTLCDYCNSKAMKKARHKKEKQLEAEAKAQAASAEQHIETGSGSGSGDDPQPIDIIEHAPPVEIKEDKPGGDCEQCGEFLDELENIDDDCDRHGITFVKTQDFSIAELYGISEYPVLVYFEANVPNVYEGSLKEEEEVLQWLIQQKTEDRIELITRVMLETMVEETQYLAVYFYKVHCNICDQILEGLEQVDDECDVFGIHMVKIQDPQLAKRYSIKTFPALVYFRNGNPLIFEGDLQNEQSVLEWLIDDDNRELADEIEEVNDRMLDRLMQESPLLCVFFYDEDCSECEEILEELENIDGEADMFGIDFVKIASLEAAHKYEVTTIPSLVYFRKQMPMLYDGDLHQYDKVLSWLTSQDVFELKNEIEEVNRKMLDKLLEENEFLTVYFFEYDHDESATALEKLENIDSETDNLDITFVKMADSRYARKWGVTKLPALVYFRKRFPSIYRGDIMSEEEVLDWLRKNRFRQPELNLFMYALIAIAIGFVLYTAFLLQCFKPAPPPPKVQKDPKDK